jgi:lysophospholipase L1-like esterase
LQHRTAEKLATYRALAASSTLATARLASLQRTITLLSKHGRVVLVRLPTGPAMAALEKAYQPHFDEDMATLAYTAGIPYLNYLMLPYPTNDGNHLTRTAAVQLSQRLADDLARLPAQP